MRGFLFDWIFTYRTVKIVVASHERNVSSPSLRHFALIESKIERQKERLDEGKDRSSINVLCVFFHHPFETRCKEKRIACTCVFSLRTRMINDRRWPNGVTCSSNCSRSSSRRTISVEVRWPSRDPHCMTKGSFLAHDWVFSGCTNSDGDVLLLSILLRLFSVLEVDR